MEDNQDQLEPGSKSERLQTGTKGEVKDSVPGSNSKSSMLVNGEDTTLWSEVLNSKNSVNTFEKGNKRSRQNVKKNKHLEALREKHQAFKK